MASIFEVVDAEKGRHAGSALRCILGGQRCIVTALHVILKAKEQGPRIAVSAGYGVAPYELHGDPDRIDEKADLAVFLLPDDYPGMSERVAFWPEEHVERSAEKRETDYLFVHGFPGVRAEVVPLKGARNLSFPYGVMQKDDLQGPVESFEFAVDFDEANMFKDTGEPTDLVAPGGMSGCPVWRIGASGLAAGAWTPACCRLVGIATWWFKPEKILGITAAARVLDLAATLSAR